MEIRIIFALSACLVSGIYGFLQKIEVETGLGRSTFIMYSYFGMFFWSAIYMIISGGKLHIESGVLLLSALGSLIYAIVFYYRLKSLKFVDSSTFFINYRILSSILLIFLGQLIFGETITFKEYLGIFLGFIIFYLLIENKKKGDSQKKLFKGILYLIIGVIGICIVQIIVKKYAISGYDYNSYLLLCGFFGLFFTYFLRPKKQNIFEIIKVKNIKIFVFLIFAGIIFTINTFLAFYAVKLGGNMVIVYKIISYSLFIPIILSIIIYKEKVTGKKLLAFILTVISIFLFAG